MQAKGYFLQASLELGLHLCVSCCVAARCPAEGQRSSLQLGPFQSVPEDRDLHPISSGYENGAWLWDMAMRQETERFNHGRRPLGFGGRAQTPGALVGLRSLNDRRGRGCVSIRSPVRSGPNMGKTQWPQRGFIGDPIGWVGLLHRESCCDSPGAALREVPRGSKCRVTRSMSSSAILEEYRIPRALG